MSTARRRLKSPRSLSSTSAHHTMVTQVNIMAAPIPEIKLFQTLTLKLHGCGQRARSYSRPSIILTPFSFHINQTNNSGDRAILKFDLETSQVMVMSEVKGEGHLFYPVSNQCTSFSFHINRTNHSWDMAKIVFDLDKTHLKFLKKICQNNSFQQNFSKI